MSARLLHLRRRDPIVRVAADVDPPLLRVSIQGELDLSVSDVLDALTEADLAGVTEVLVDLEGMTFCDLAGFQAIARLHDAFSQQRRTARLLRPQRCFLRIAGLIGRDDLLAAS